MRSKLIRAIRPLFFTGSLLLIAAMVRAQDSTSKPSWNLSGAIDGYYRYNFSNAKSSSNPNNFTSFTNSQNSFELGMASVRVDYLKGKTAATIDLGFGQRAREFSYNETGVAAAVKQAFISYSPSAHLKLSFGKWATHIGFELVDAWLNRNYSMDYLFSYGPFSHTGVKAEFQSGNLGFMAGISNPPDMASASFAPKFLIGQVSLASDDGQWKGYLNYAGGRYENAVSSHQADLVITGVASPEFNMAFNGTVQMLKPDSGQSAAWWGSALYLNYDPVPLFGLTLRAEYFGDPDGVSGLAAATGVAGSMVDFTLSGNIRLDNLTLIPEWRIDRSNRQIFEKHNGQPTRNSQSIIVAAVFHF